MNAFFKHTCRLVIIVNFVFILLFCSCSKFGAGKRSTHECTFLTGECLNSTKLIYDESTFDISRNTMRHLAEIGYVNVDIENYPYPDCTVITLAFRLDLDKTFDRIGKCFLDRTFRYVPDYEVYKQFGSNASLVKKEYENIYNEIEFSSRSNYYTTIYYGAEPTITADKDFAGYRAGENLKKIVYISSFYDDKLLQIPGISNDESLNVVSYRLGVFIPTDNFKLVDETVIFNIAIPVKCAMYLNWLNERMSNNDAELQYKDVTLTCTFSINKALQPEV